MGYQNSDFVLNCNFSKIMKIIMKNKFYKVLWKWKLDLIPLDHKFKQPRSLSTEG